MWPPIAWASPPHCCKHIESTVEKHWSVFRKDKELVDFFRKARKVPWLVRVVGNVCPPMKTHTKNDGLAMCKMLGCTQMLIANHAKDFNVAVIIIIIIIIIILLVGLVCILRRSPEQSPTIQWLPDGAVLADDPIISTLTTPKGWGKESAVDFFWNPGDNHIYSELTFHPVKLCNWYWAQESVTKYNPLNNTQRSLINPFLGGGCI